MADIPINDGQWNALSQDNRNLIEHKLREAGVLGPEDHIYPDPNISAELGLGSWLCEAACEATAAAGRAACLSLGDPISIAACLAAVAVARKKCLELC